MRELPAGLEAQLAAGVTTLCRCWLLERTDAVKLGFTDHDRDLAFDGATFEALAGINSAEVTQSFGLAIDTTEIAGALQSEKIAESDLAAGLYDNAKLTLFLVDWSEVANRAVIFAGSVGEVSRGRVHFQAEMRGLAHALNQERGRVYSRGCDADLGDARCGIDLDLPEFKGTGTITAATSNRSFAASGLAAFVDGWFKSGKLVWATGANAGAAIEVKFHSNSGTTVRFELWETMPFDIEVGDTFTVTAGCDKALATCLDRFDNVANFRGFPYIPGNDALTSYANTGDVNDGSSRFG
ncbi:MAG: DUF2163 domain-containing protein [Xanthobacteraceae bacterium]